MESEKLIEAAKLLKENCAGIEKNCYKDKVNCPFQRKYMKGLTYYCELGNDTAQWYLPEVQDDEAVQDLMAFKERYTKND